MTIELKIDYRLGGIPRYRLVEEGDNLMQIPDEIRKCVIFVGYKTSKGVNLAGTAFLFGVPLSQPDLISCYVITAKHVINAIRERSIDQKVYLRMNLKNTGVQLIEVPIEMWLFHPKEDDVDVAVLNWVPSREVFDFRFIPLDMAATREIIEKENIGVGDDVFIAGLFANHYGSQRNVPIIRVGNIASMPEEKVHTKWGDIDAYLIEARSIGGLSGSPTFAHLGAMRTIGGNLELGRKGAMFYLLGLVQGHFDLGYTEMDKLTEDNLYNLQVNMGIAIVIPVWKILEVINQDIFMNKRALDLQQALEKSSPVLDNMTEINKPAST